MGPETAIMLFIWVIVILGIAWAITWALGNAGVPQPLIMGVWIIAALLLLLLLLRNVGVLHVG